MMGQEKKKVLESMSCYVFTKKSKYDTTVLHATKKVILPSTKIYGLLTI